MFDTNLTIYNVYRDYQNDQREYHRTNLHGVNWQGKNVQDRKSTRLNSSHRL